MKSLLGLLRNEQGATAIEYALIASLISMVIVGAIVVIGQGQGGMFGFITDQVSPALSGALNDE